MRFFALLIALLFSLNIHALSSLPSQPGGNCNAYEVWHKLRDLRSAMETWFDPNAEQFIYSKLGPWAPDTSVLRSTMERAYENLREAYIELQKSPQFLEMQTGDFPELTRVRMSTAESLYRYALFVHAPYGKFKTLVHKKMWDHRYIRTFFLSTIVDRQHRPLESFERLTISSVRARRALERLEEIVAGQMAETDHLAISMINSLDQFDDGKGRFETRDLQIRLDVETEMKRHQLRNLTERLYAGAQHANDMVLGRIPSKNFEAMKEQMAKLGEGLRTSLELVSIHSKIRRAGVPRREYVEDKGGVLLSGINEDLNELFNAGGHFYSTNAIPPNMRGEHDENVYRLYSESLLIQYVITAGASMAKLRETSEVRGGVGAKLLQESRYRWARIASMKKPAKTGRAVAKLGEPMDNATHAPRSAFLTEKRQAEASALEDQLWKIFFDHAKLGESPWTNQGCGPALIEAV